MDEKRSNPSIQPRQQPMSRCGVSYYRYELQELNKNEKMEIFVLAGQSNMSGRGGVHGSVWDAIVPGECRPCSQIARLSANLQWEVAHEPLHFDIDTGKVCGIGPGMVFANEIVKHFQYPPDDAAAARIGLVPCAIGGTAIEEWRKGSKLYEQMICRTKHALHCGGVLRAILWYQGESDTLSEATANAYKNNIQRLIFHIRTDLNLPDLLFIQVAINMESQTPELVQRVREAQLSLNIPNVYTVDAEGLPLKSDKLHLPTEAQLQLGKLLANEYIKYGNTKVLGDG